MFEGEMKGNEAIKSDPCTHGTCSGRSSAGQVDQKTAPPEMVEERTKASINETNRAGLTPKLLRTSKTTLKHEEESFRPVPK